VRWFTAAIVLLSQVIRTDGLDDLSTLRLMLSRIRILRPIRIRR
jgi:hypothetical protein